VAHGPYEVSCNGRLRTTQHEVVTPINPHNPGTQHLVATFAAGDGPTRAHIREAVIPLMHATIEANHSFGVLCEKRGLIDVLESLEGENTMLAKLIATARKRLGSNHR